MTLNSLAFRLFVAAAAWSLALLGVGAILLSNLFGESVERGFDERLNVYLSSLLASVEWTPDGSIKSVGNIGETRFDNLYSGWYWQVSEPGADYSNASRSLWVERLELPGEAGPEANEEGIREVDVTGPRGEPLRVVERLITYEAANRTYAFAVAGNRAEMDDEIAAFRRAVVWALAILGLCLVVSTIFQVHFGLRPLRTISRQLADIRSGKAARLEGDFPAEIRPLANELNALVDSNTAVLQRARTHVGNLAHALKTPLSVISNEAANGRGVLAKKVREQAGLMRSQITHHLERASMAARSNVIGVVTEVEPAAEAVARAMRKIHAERGIAVTLRCQSGIMFAGEQQDLDEILGNLMDNACKWAVSAVQVEIARMADRAQDTPRFRLTVDDDGAGLTAAQREEVMRRGARLDESQPGSGLGLSIVLELVQLYGGTLALAPSPSGGLRAEAELPAV